MPERHDIRRLVPEVTKLPKCEATVRPETRDGATQYYREARKRYAEKHGTFWDQCKHGAKWFINGRHLCTRHAGIEALEVLQRLAEAQFPEGTWRGKPFSQLSSEERQQMIEHMRK
jgi:hypothetical protein